MKSSMCPARSSRLVNWPRRRTRRVSAEKKISAWFSQEARMRGQPGAGLLRGVRGTVVHDQVNVPACGDGRVQEPQELDEGAGVVAGDRLGEDLAGVHVQRGDDGDGAVPDVLELPSGAPARRAGQVGVFAGAVFVYGFVDH